SGEPTLHTGFGEVLKFLQKSPIPSALLTNGSMLYRPEVREAASYANLVKISLSAWDQHSFWWINRPHPELKFEQLIEGQKNFRIQFKGELWMEVLLMLGMNSMPDDVKKIAAFVQEIRPDRIQLNTVVRPPAENFAVALSNERLKILSRLFDPPAEVIAECSIDHVKDIQVSEDGILSMLKRRPCTTEQIGQAFNMHINEVSKHLSRLMETYRIHTDYINTNIYYSAAIKEKALDVNT
ncbi:MAG: radical SAM protein, partial [Deltaproteobacteria bacterium]|nr:radical SAM protein [Deltaproteobacteria bacterium]